MKSCYSITELILRKYVEKKMFLKSGFWGHVNLFEMFWHLIIPETQGFDPQAQHSGFYSMFDLYWNKLISQKLHLKIQTLCQNGLPCWQKTPVHTFLFLWGLSWASHIYQVSTRTNKLKNKSTSSDFDPDLTTWEARVDQETYTTRYWHQPWKKTHSSLHTHPHMHVQPEVFPPKHYFHTPHCNQSSLST